MSVRYCPKCNYALQGSVAVGDLVMIPKSGPQVWCVCPCDHPNLIFKSFDDTRFTSCPDCGNRVYVYEELNRTRDRLRALEEEVASIPGIRFRHHPYPHMGGK